MRRAFRHLLSGIFITSIIAAAAIVMYFTFPYLQSNVDSLRAAIAPDQQHAKKHISIGDNVVIAYIADTDAKRVAGLSNYPKLADNFGMLFAFETIDFHGIWMKDMNFPIDILWINDRSEIVHIEKNADPASYPHIFYPTYESMYVLEVNAGFADAHDIRLGDVVAIY